MLTNIPLDTEVWMKEANCAGTDPEAFFPESDSSNIMAKKVCGNCTVVDQCLDYALNDKHLSGIWGGTTNLRRNQMRREQRYEEEMRRNAKAC